MSDARSVRPLALAGLALVGLAIAGYLTAFQVGMIGRVWDPLFGTGSERVLTSPISRLLPLPDASLGAAVYGIDLVLALAVAFGVGPRDSVRRVLAVVASLGAIASIVLVVLQPLIAAAFCSLCLGSAAISIVLALGAIAELRDGDGASASADPPAPPDSRPGVGAPAGTTPEEVHR